jgi:hypothetical protein
VGAAYLRWLLEVVSEKGWQRQHGRTTSRLVRRASFRQLMSSMPLRRSRNRQLRTEMRRRERCEMYCRSTAVFKSRSENATAGETYFRPASMLSLSLNIISFVLVRTDTLALPYSLLPFTHGTSSAILPCNSPSRSSCKSLPSSKPR